MNEHVDQRSLAGRSAPVEPGLVAASVYADGRKVADLAAVEDAAAWLGRPGHVIWIGLFEPSDDLLSRVQRQFGLHDLAIEDAGNAHQRPKLEQYGDGAARPAPRRSPTARTTSSTPCSTSSSTITAR